MTDANLWPDFDDVPKIISPRTILNEQANFLSEKTKNLLQGKVIQSNGSDEKMVHLFKIVAPLLKGYSYTLFHLYHGLFYYPCDIIFQNAKAAIQNEAALLEYLKYIFNDKTTKDIISSLLGQSKEFQKEEDLPF